MFEGDGTLVTSVKGFSFIIYSIHKPTLQEIKNVLGFGNIYFDVKSEKWSYRVETRYEIYLLLLILNGNLVLNHRYYNFIFVAKEFNKRSFKGKIFFKQLNILKYSSLPTLNDAWISGFTDAEGHFGLPIENLKKILNTKNKKIYKSFVSSLQKSIWLKNKKDFSTFAQDYRLEPWFVSGFCDGESTFHISIIRNKNFTVGWNVIPRFQLGLHQKDFDLLLQLKQFFGGSGSIIKQGRNSFQYRVSAVNDLFLIIEHFENYPLITQKKADFYLFKKVIELMKNKEHLSIDGLQQIINIRASMNLGLSDLQKSEFPNTIPVERILIYSTNIPDANWIAGFSSGEGSFHVNIKKSATKIGHQVLLKFSITQNERDKILLGLISKYLGSGILYNNRTWVDLTITKFSDITKIIIPFFLLNPIRGIKQYDFQDFCLVANLITEGKHLTIEGLELIRKIKARMNTGRK